jgi:two-component system phosphate regulon sensor histidine kinase PhoR
MKLSVRLWQTALFVTVITVAMLVLSLTLMSTLETSIRDLAREQLSKDADELSGIIAPYFPPDDDGRAEIHRHVLRFEQTFDEDVWVFDKDGRVIESWNTRTQPGGLLDAAKRGVLGSDIPYTYVDLEKKSIALAGDSIRDDSGVTQGGIVVATRGAEVTRILSASRDQLVVAFFVALGVSGLLGFVFSEVITRQVQRLATAAEAIANGDFSQRLRRGPVPDEIAGLAESYNRMAEQLGRAFAAVEGKEREIAAVVESMAEGVVAVDREQVIRLVNPIAAVLLGMPAQRLLGQRLADIPGGPELVSPVDEALAGRQSNETLLFGDRILYLHGTPFALGTKEGGAALLLRDITEQKRWEQAQRAFTANASHELRTPIAALKGFIELLQAGAKERVDVRDDFLETMQVEIDRLQRLVSDLFTLAQLDMGELRLDIGPQRAEDMISDVVAVMSPLAAEAGIALSSRVAPDASSVLCDRDRVVQVLLGFVDNALKHTPRGGGITLWAAPDDGKIRIGVRDTGPGIRAGAADRVFDRFFSVKADSPTSQRGTGLGLAIAKEIVEAHGSGIEVHSEPGRGADFSFPLTKP